MLGSITTRDKCVCGGSFIWLHDTDLYCNKCGAIYRGRSYRVRYGSGKNRHDKTLHTPKKALQHLSVIRSKLGQPDLYGMYDARDWRRSNPLGIKKLGQDWLKKKASTRPPLTKSRMGECRNALKRLLNLLGDMNIKTISEIELTRFYSHGHHKLNDPGAGLSSKSVYDICNTLNEFFRWGSKIARCQPPQFNEIGYDYVETEPITIQQQVAIVDWIKTNCTEPKIWFAVAILCRNPNIRPSALCSVRWRDIDQISGIFYIHKRKSRRKIKRGAIRPKKAFLNDELTQLLLEYSYIDLNEYFFTYTVNRSGVTPGMKIHPKVLNIWVKRAGRSLGIDTTLYAATKHTTTTELSRHHDREVVRQFGSEHRTNDAFSHYDHSNSVYEQERLRRSYDDMTSKLRRVK